MKCELEIFLTRNRGEFKTHDAISNYAESDKYFFDNHLGKHPECSIDVQTSGTSGPPKVISVELSKVWWATKMDNRKLSWYSSYLPKSMGFLQVQLYAIKNSHSHSRHLSSSSNAISTTPSLFRKMLITNELAKLDIQQLSFGGEHADQTILDIAKRTFPMARVSHTYASSEFGQVFATSDGSEGFPIQQLTANSKHIIEIKNGELFVGTSANSLVGSGDLFETTTDRVYFKGRMGESGNVAGVMVYPQLLVNLLRTDDDILDAKCWLEPNPITGNLVACQIVPRGDLQHLNRRLLTRIKSELGRAYRPARFEQVSVIALSESGKS